MPAAVTPIRTGWKPFLKREIFHVGNHTDSKGNTRYYSAEDLNQIVDNFHLLRDGVDGRPIHKPPAGRGHDTAESVPDDALGDAALRLGEVTDLWTEEKQIAGTPTLFLMADMELCQELSALVDSGKLYRISPEIIDEPPSEGSEVGANGMYLRRVGLLGYQPPAVKFLEEFGPSNARAKYGEPFIGKIEGRPIVREGRKGVAFFCEVNRIDPQSFEGANMDRQQILTWLQEKGFDTSTITDAVPDALLQMLYQTMQENEQLKSGGAAPMSEPGQNPGTATAPKQVTLKYSEAQLDSLFSEVRTLKGQLYADKQNGESLAVRERRTRVKNFCEQQVKDGRLSPADVECDKASGEPLPHTTYARLLRAANSPAVHKFSEGGKTSEKTELELQMAEIEARPRRSFSERVQAQKPGVLQGSRSAADEGRDFAKKYAERRKGQMSRAS